MSPSPSPSSRRFEIEIDVAATPESLWNALASGPGLESWFAPEARVTPGVGGEILWSWSEFHRWPQRIEVWEPGRRLCTSYPSAVAGPDGTPRPLFLDFRLEGRGGRTTLRLVHSGFGPEAGFDGEYDGIRRGWPVELASLQLYLERHAGKARRLAWSRAELPLDHAVAWARLTGPEGLACGVGVQDLAPGQPFRFTTTDGDVFAGKTLHAHDHELAGVVHSHGESFLRIAIERCGGKTSAWLWLATYGRQQAEVEGLQKRWDAMLERLFAATAESRA